MKTVAVIVGTRPEAIKLWPVISSLRLDNSLKTYVINTGQHGEMLSETLLDLGIEIDSDFRILSKATNLVELLSKLIDSLGQEFSLVRPDLVMVQGDTLSAYAGAVVAFLQGIKIAHVESGLRTKNVYSPFPEEFCRQSIAKIADLNFAPTPLAKRNLIEEGIDPQRVTLSGNTIVDATYKFQRELGGMKFENERIKLRDLSGNSFTLNESKFALVTLHRRENVGEMFDKTLGSIAEVAMKNKDFQFVFPVHPNPNIRGKAIEQLGDITNVKLLPPQSYTAFMRILSHCSFVISDSGGIQEEAITLRKPIYVARRDTERAEGLSSGIMFMLNGTQESMTLEIVDAISKYSQQQDGNEHYVNPFGDGTAAEKIVSQIKLFLNPK